MHISKKSELKIVLSRGLEGGRSGVRYNESWVGVRKDGVKMREGVEMGGMGEDGGGEWDEWDGVRMREEGWDGWDG